jgi:hypothetical protein
VRKQQHNILDDYIITVLFCPILTVSVLSVTPPECVTQPRMRTQQLFPLISNSTQVPRVREGTISFQLSSCSSTKQKATADLICGKPLAPSLCQVTEKGGAIVCLSGLFRCSCTVASWLLSFILALDELKSPSLTKSHRETKKSPHSCHQRITYNGPFTSLCCCIRTPRIRCRVAPTMMV